MQNRWSQLPAWAKVVIYFSVLCLATFIAGLVPPINDFWFFLCIAMIMSWWMLRKEGKKLRSLGWVPSSAKDVGIWSVGLIVGIVMLLLTTLLTLCLSAAEWKWNSAIVPMHLLVTFFACLWSAFVQEFVFRGYPFQVLLQHYSHWKAQWIIAIPFGLMHLHHGMPVQDMALIMLTTGLGSVLFGLTYLKTGKLFLPIGVHMGWNYAQVFFPRVTNGGKAGIISITHSPAQYNSWQVIVPYVLVMCMTIVLFFSIRKSSAAGIKPL